MKFFFTTAIYFLLISKIFAVEPYSIFFQGELITYSQTNLLYPTPTEAQFIDKYFIFSQDQTNYITMIGIDFKTNPGIYNLIIKSFDSVINIIPIIILQGNFRDEFLRVNKKYVHFTPDIVDRINMERKTLNSIYSKPLTKRLFNEDFIHPLRKGTFITSHFGTRRIYNNSISGRHGGIDFRAAVGTPVKSINAGIVELVGHFFLPGKLVVINHGAGIYSSYLHMSSFSVKTGDKVRKGQVIGKTGVTGRITGPHLDFRININRNTIDPMQIFNIKLDI